MQSNLVIEGDVLKVGGTTVNLSEHEAALKASGVDTASIEALTAKLYMVADELTEGEASELGMIVIPQHVEDGSCGTLVGAVS